MKSYRTGKEPAAGGKHHKQEAGATQTSTCNQCGRPIPPHETIFVLWRQETLRSPTMTRCRLDLAESHHPPGTPAHQLTRHRHFDSSRVYLIRPRRPRLPLPARDPQQTDRYATKMTTANVPSVQTCGRTQLPVASQVAVMKGCFISVNAINATASADAGIDTQQEVLDRLGSLIGCLP